MDELIKRTIEFIKYRHRYQIRKYTTDQYYYLHCIEVMTIVSRSPICTFKMKIAALLHDTLEDTDATIEELIAIYGKEVTTMVIGLTDVSKPEDGNRKVRKEMDRKHLGEQDMFVQTIKVADLLANAKDILQKDPEKFGPVFIEEAKLLSQVLTKACPVLKQELDQLLNSMPVAS